MSGPHDTYVWFDLESIEGRFKRLEDELDDICFPKPAKVTLSPVIHIGTPPTVVTPEQMKRLAAELAKHLEGMSRRMLL